MHFNKKNIGAILVILTIVKIIFIYFFFQHIVIYDGQKARIGRAYAWGELVENMHRGEYVNTSQYSLAHLYDFKFHALRPPLYAFWLYFVSLFGKYAGIVAVLGQSIITSLIAWVGYKIVRLRAKNEWAPLLTLAVLFFLPMNFFKSGTLDDAPLMLLFLLYGLYFLMKPGQETNQNRNAILAGLFFGLALLTRPAALFPIAGVSLYMLLSKYYSFKNLLIIGFVILLVLSPWLIRNTMVIGKPVYTNGAGRFFLLLQSEEFIRNFPEESIDVIDNTYFTNHYEELKYINHLSEAEKDAEFMKLARDQFVSRPENFFSAVKVKMKVFLPYRYYPYRTGFWKNAVYMLQYILALVAFIFALVLIIKKKVNLTRSIVLMTVAAISYLSIGLLLILLSRHFYPLIVMLFIVNGIGFSGMGPKAMMRI